MSRPLSLLSALALAAASPAAQAAPSFAGCYNGSAPEIAAELQLLANGRFRYGLAYGALDERAEGRWESNEAAVILIGDPVTPPRFSLVGEGLGPSGAYRVRLDLPEGMDRQYFRILLTLAEGEPVERQFAEDGLTVELGPRDRVVEGQLLLGVYGVLSEPFALAGGNGREARFRFEPNDLGKADFARTPLPRDGANLLLERHGRLLRFRPVKGGCKD